MPLSSRLKRHTPELLTGLALLGAILLIELRKQPINLSPAPAAWIESRQGLFPRELVDTSGRTLSIAARPRRIVSQTLGSDELLLGVCAGDQLVGVSPAALDEAYSNVAHEVQLRNLRPLGNPEQIVEARPDVVFVASYSSAEQVELLRGTGIQVFEISNFDSIAGIEGNLRAVAYAAGDDDCANRLIAQLQSRLEKVRAAARLRKTAPRVMEYGTAGYTAGARTLIDEMIRVAGGRNITAEHGIKGSLRLSSEVIAMWQPDYIVAGAPHGEAEQVRRALLSDPAIANSRAGRTSRIIVIDDRFLICVSQYIVSGIEQLAEALSADRSGRPVNHG